MRWTPKDWFKRKVYETKKLTNPLAIEMIKVCQKKPIETDIIKMKRAVNK